MRFHYTGSENVIFVCLLISSVFKGLFGTLVVQAVVQSCCSNSAQFCPSEALSTAVIKILR